MSWLGCVVFMDDPQVHIFNFVRLLKQRFRDSFCKICQDQIRRHWSLNDIRVRETRMLFLEGVATGLVAFKAFVFVEYEFSHFTVAVS